MSLSETLPTMRGASPGGGTKIGFDKINVQEALTEGGARVFQEATFISNVVNHIFGDRVTVKEIINEAVAGGPDKKRMVPHTITGRDLAYEPEHRALSAAAKRIDMPAGVQENAIGYRVPEVLILDEITKEELRSKAEYYAQYIVKHVEEKSALAGKCRASMGVTGFGPQKQCPVNALGEIVQLLYVEQSKLLTHIATTCEEEINAFKIVATGGLLVKTEEYRVLVQQGLETGIVWPEADQAAGSSWQKKRIREFIKSIQPNSSEHQLHSLLETLVQKDLENTDIETICDEVAKWYEKHRTIDASFGQVTESANWADTVQDQDDRKETEKRAKICWRCGGDHMRRNCQSREKQNKQGAAAEKEFKDSRSSRQGAGRGGGRRDQFRGKCYKCDKTGHRANDCTDLGKIEDAKKEIEDPKKHTLEAFVAMMTSDEKRAFLTEAVDMAALDLRADSAEEKGGETMYLALATVDDGESLDMEGDDCDIAADTTSTMTNMIDALTPSYALTHVPSLHDVPPTLTIDLNVDLVPVSSESRAPRSSRVPGVSDVTPPPEQSRATIEGASLSMIAKREDTMDEKKEHRSFDEKQGRSAVQIIQESLPEREVDRRSMIESIQGDMQGLVRLEDLRVRLKASHKTAEEEEVARVRKAHTLARRLIKEREDTTTVRRHNEFDDDQLRKGPIEERTLRTRFRDMSKTEQSHELDALQRLRQITENHRKHALPSDPFDDEEIQAIPRNERPVHSETTYTAENISSRRSQPFQVIADSGASENVSGDSSLFDHDIRFDPAAKVTRTATEGGELRHRHYQWLLTKFHDADGHVITEFPIHVRFEPKMGSDLFLVSLGQMTDVSTKSYFTGGGESQGIHIWDDNKEIVHIPFLDAEGTTNKSKLLYLKVSTSPMPKGPSSLMSGIIESQKNHECLVNVPVSVNPRITKGTITRGSLSLLHTMLNHRADETVMNTVKHGRGAELSSRHRGICSSCMLGKPRRNNKNRTIRFKGNSQSLDGLLGDGATIGMSHKQVAEVKEKALDHIISIQSQLRGKHQRQPLAAVKNPVTMPLQKVSCDYIGPFKIGTRNGGEIKIGFTIYVDYATGFVWIFNMKSKGDLHETLSSMVDEGRALSLSIREIVVDPAGENTGDAFKAVCSINGITPRTLNARSQFGSYVERKIQQLQNDVRVTLIHGKLPLSFLQYTFAAVVSVHNKIGSRGLHWKSPHFALYGVDPDLSKLHVIGSTVYIAKPRALLPGGSKYKSKLGPLAIQGIYFGTTKDGMSHMVMRLDSGHTGEMLRTSDFSGEQLVMPRSAPLEILQRYNLTRQPTDPNSGFKSFGKITTKTDEEEGELGDLEQLSQKGDQREVEAEEGRETTRIDSTIAKAKHVQRQLRALRLAPLHDDTSEANGKIDEREVDIDMLPNPLNDEQGPRRSNRSNHGVRQFLPEFGVSHSTPDFAMQAQQISQKDYDEAAKRREKGEPRVDDEVTLSHGISRGVKKHTDEEQPLMLLIIEEWERPENDPASRIQMGEADSTSAIINIVDGRVDYVIQRKDPYGAGVGIAAVAKDTGISYKDAIDNNPDPHEKKEFQKALFIEWDVGIVGKQVIEYMSRDDVPPDTVIGNLMTIFCVKRYQEPGENQGKIRKFKARVVFRGDQVDTSQMSKDMTYAPTADLSSGRLILGLAKQEGIEYLKADVTGAFTNASPTSQVIANTSQGCHRWDTQGRRMVCKLLMNLYGSVEAAARWCAICVQQLLRMGLRQSMYDACLFRIAKPRKEMEEEIDRWETNTDVDLKFKGVNIHDEDDDEKQHAMGAYAVLQAYENDQGEYHPSSVQSAMDIMDSGTNEMHHYVGPCDYHADLMQANYEDHIVMQPDNDAKDVLWLVLSLYVDDVLIVSNSHKLARYIGRRFLHLYPGTHEWEPGEFLGQVITRNAGITKLDQDVLLRKAIETAHMTKCKPKKTPLAEEVTVGTDDQIAAERYEAVAMFDPRIFNGELGYLRNAFPWTVHYHSLFARVANRPTIDNIRAMKRFCRYLTAQQSRGVQFRSDVPQDLFIYVDTSFDVITYTGIFVFAFGGCVYAKSLRQRFKSLSTFDAETAGLNEAAKVAITFRGIVRDCGVRSKYPTMILGDNKASIDEMTNAKSAGSRKPRHHRVRAAWTKQLVAQKIIEFRHVVSADNVADIGTKVITDKELWRNLKDQVMGVTKPVAIMRIAAETGRV